MSALAFSRHVCICVCAAGAAAFPAASRKRYKAKQLKFKQVSHVKQEFTNVVNAGPYGTRLSGTQQLDSTWGHMKKWTPPVRRVKVRAAVNKDIFAGCFAFQWRHKVIAKGLSLAE